MSQTTAEYVAAEVRAELGRQGHTSKWLAEQTGRSEVWASRHLRNAAEWSVDDLMDIADALDIPATQLLPVRERAA